MRFRSNVRSGRWGEPDTRFEAPRVTAEIQEALDHGHITLLNANDTPKEVLKQEQRAVEKHTEKVQRAEKMQEDLGKQAEGRSPKEKP